MTFIVSALRFSKISGCTPKSLTTKQLQEADNRITRAAARNMVARFNRQVLGILLP